MVGMRRVRSWLRCRGYWWFAVTQSARGFAMGHRLDLPELELLVHPTYDRDRRARGAMHG